VKVKIELKCHLKEKDIFKKGFKIWKNIQLPNFEFWISLAMYFIPISDVLHS
jgi:hypothetical protein